MRRHTFLPVMPVTLSAMLLGACATATVQAPAPAKRSMTAIIDSIADAPPMQHTSWGIQVLDQQTGRLLYDRNGDRHFIPASNTKLAVTTAAMGMLGPEWRYRTQVLRGRTTSSGAIAGLLIVGSGDPTFSARFLKTPLAFAFALADSVSGAGVTQIDGPIIVDASRFTDAPINGTWEVGDLPGGSAPPVGALAIDESIFRVILEPGASAGAPVTARFPDWPGGAGGQPLNLAAVRTDTAGARGSISSDFLMRRDTIYLSGTVPLGKPDTSSYSITDPAAYAGRAVAAALTAKGIRVAGDVIVARDAADAAAARTRIDATPFVEFTSPPVSDIVSAILHPSQNWIAEMLIKTIGAERGTGGSWRGGLAAERTYLIQSAGLDSADFSLRDASGMAPQNLLSPHAIVRMLEHTRAAPWGSLYRAGLAAPGETGTLQNRLTEYTGRLRGKTGTISNVATLSGFLVTDNGREVTFSIMTNGTGLSSAVVRRAVDEIVRTIARETPR